MKLLMVALFAAMGVGLAGCSGDEDDPGDQSDIVGTWRIDYDVDDDDYPYSTMLTFEKSGRFSGLYWDGEPEPEGAGYGQYKIKGSSLTLNWESSWIDWGEEDEDYHLAKTQFTIISIQREQLILRYEYDEFRNGEIDDGGDVVDGTLVFRRVN